MLDVALDELPRGGAQEVLAREVGPREDERQDVLQLVAEAEGAAGLVVARSAPRGGSASAWYSEPAVHEDVEASRRAS